MAPAVYDGAPTVQRHYNADGDLIGWTETESPWDDDSRGEAEALWESEFLMCPHCGHPREDCSDPERAEEWAPQRSICYATMSQQAAERKYSALHEKQPYHDGRFKTWSEKPGPRAPFHFHDGVRVWSSPYDLTPDDNWLEPRKAVSRGRSRGEDPAPR